MRTNLSKYIFFILQAEVIYVDYGNIEVVLCSAVMELPAQYASVPPYATRYWLYGYQPAAIPPAKMQEVLRS
jgi:Tudor domain